MSIDFKSLLSSFKAPEAAVIPERTVGIDVGSASIKVVELEKTGETVTLQSYGELQLGPYADKALGEVATLEPTKLSEALSEVLKKSDITATSGVLAIPLEASFVTVVPITARPGEDLTPKIRIEARKYIPVPLSEVTLDWNVLHQYGNEKSQVNDVLLAAIQNEAYSRYRTLMAEVAMTSEPAEIEVFSTVRGLFRPDDTSLAVIDLGAETSKLYIANDAVLERIHRVYDGGMNATRKIAATLDIGFEAAENKKRLYTEDSEHATEIKQAFFTSVERPAEEFARVIEQYEARAGKPIGRVVVTGGGALFPGVTQYVSDVLTRDVVLAQPFGKVAYPAVMEATLSESGSLFATALGAAIRPFNIV